MDFQSLREQEPKLIKEMRKRGYAETYINRHRTIISQILSNEPKHHWQSYDDVFDWYVDTYQSQTYIHEIRAVVGNLEAYHLQGRYPNGREGTNFLCGSRASYYKLNMEYKSIMDFYSNTLSDRDLRESTCYSALHKSASFLYDLQQQGENRLSEVTEAGVVRCFFRDGKRVRDASCTGVIKRFLTGCIDYSIECKRLVVYVPKFRHQRKNIQYLSSDEVSRFKAVIDDTGNELSYKDRAIGMMLLFTGMRGCDLAHLYMDSIGWNKDVIRFSQQKTMQVVELPLIPIVGNAIYDYCVNERPQNDCNCLFLNDYAPHRGLTTDGIGTAVNRLMAAANIRQESGNRRGTHIFRYRLVNALLDNDIATPVISSTIGHTSPNSLEAYLYANIVHLKSCSLPIEDFHISEEVFNND